MGIISIIIGKDDFLVNTEAKKRIGKCSSVEVIDAGSATNAADQLASLQKAHASFFTPPFFEPEKITWWRDVKFLPGARLKGDEDDLEDKISEEVKTALERFAEQLAAAPVPANQSFILTAPSLLKASIFAKRLKAAGAEFVTLEEEKKDYLRQQSSLERVREFAAEEGFSFAPGAAEAFVARVGNDTRSLLQEVRKLRDYLGPDTKVATAADVSEVSSPGVGIESSSWAVTDALGARDTAALVAALQRFETENGFAVFMTTVAEKYLRQLLELKAAQEAGTSGAIEKTMNPFVFRKMCGFATKWTLLELRRARERVMLLREKIVSSSGAADKLVFTEFIRICKGTSRRGRS